MENKFELEKKPSRKQWFFSAEDDFILYRQHVFELAEKVCELLRSNKTLKVLEIGPSHGLYQESIQQYDSSIIKKTCQEFGLEYHTLDLDPDSQCDYHGSIEDLSFLDQKFDVVVLLGILEHVRQLHLVPEQLFNILNSGGMVFINTPFLLKVHGPEPDCWRISEYGYQALFGEKFRMSIDTYPKNELGKNSLPLSYNVILEKPWVSLKSFL